MGLCLHPLASVALPIKWVLSLPKISVKFSARGDHSINGRCCQCLSAEKLQSLSADLAATRRWRSGA